MMRFISVLALLLVMAVFVPGRAETARTVTIINTDYALVNVRRTKTIGDPAAGGATANSMFVVLTFRVHNEAKGPRRLMLAQSTLEDRSARHYSMSVEGVAALLRTSPSTLTPFTAGFDVQAHTKETVTVVFDVPETINTFTINVPNPNDYFKSGKIAFSS